MRSPGSRTSTTSYGSNQSRAQSHQNPFMAQTQMGERDGQGSNGQSQGRGQSQGDETKAGMSGS